MKAEGFLIMCIAVSLWSTAWISAGEKKTITMTILYDNYVYAEGTHADWGFACLIEGADKTILFDTGTRPDILMENVKTLKVDLKKIDTIVISHDHGDHTGGLGAVLKENPDVEVYMPVSFAGKYREKYKDIGLKVISVDATVKICSGITTTGEMGSSIKEQSLICETDEGVVVVTGCSHQGILEILKKTKEITEKDIYLVFGGFHLMEHSDEAMSKILHGFRSAGVKKCGATHCTGDHQIELFKKEYGKDYVPVGVGRVLSF
jgi:7,8-dihydropterin-6-yl-methyl-4-(beta-D-ribofuranosyl)aminobenzene 5'-phosphate synthase